MSFTAFFVGRFQPLHLGHINALEQILADKPDKIVIGIGSSESELTFKNPLSFYERKEIIITGIKEAFKDEIEIVESFEASPPLPKRAGGISKTLLQICPIPDFANSHKWTDYILENLPHFDTLYSANPYTQSCFADTDKNFKELELNKFIKAVHIRQLMTQDLNWKPFILESTKEILVKKDISERIKEISNFEDELVHGKFWLRRDKSNLLFQKAKILIVEKYTDWECLQNEDFANFDYSEKLEILNQGHKDHISAKDSLELFLREEKIDYCILKPDQIKDLDYTNFNLVFTLGGDGTFLEAVKKASKQLIIGINSQPNKSVGKLTSFKLSNFESLFQFLIQNKELILSNEFSIVDLELGELKVKNLDRIQVKINDKPIEYLAINEVYIGNPVIYQTSHLTIELDKHKGTFSCNGVLVSTYQGLSAFYSSAGGKEFSSKEFAYQVLLNYNQIGDLAENEILDLKQTLRITPERLNHSIVFDGDSNREIKLRQGDSVQVFVKKENCLKVLG
jgi:nicotinamide-nucleotide adenylyltransferase